VSNSSIIEDLGQVHYLFSDKTGTLTKNLMSMRAVAIGDCTFDSDENGFKISEF
jgi:P-type E1-E2 ATPase